MGLSESALRLRAERASVLSNNLANIDTPYYKARDINFQEAFSAQMGDGLKEPMKATHQGHFNMSASGNGTGMSERYYRTPMQPSIDGNTVEENIEHAEYMKNSLEFQVAFTLLNSKFKGMTKAIKGE
ncbi:Flagellar basal body rod protein FlgB [Thalassocella blandensis]|nr:Flagellar basal body rod protein FlgB [Thalassocella blandensis]